MRDRWVAYVKVGERVVFKEFPGVIRDLHATGCVDRKTYWYWRKLTLSSEANGDGPGHA